MEGRLRELAYLNRKISISHRFKELDEEGKAYTKTFYSEGGGITEFVELIDKNANRLSLIPRVVNCEGHDPSTNVAVEVAMIYNAATRNIFQLCK